MSAPARSSAPGDTTVVAPASDATAAPAEVPLYWHPCTGQRLPITPNECSQCNAQLTQTTQKLETKNPAVQQRNLDSARLVVPLAEVPKPVPKADSSASPKSPQTDVTVALMKLEDAQRDPATSVVVEGGRNLTRGVVHSSGVKRGGPVQRKGSTVEAKEDPEPRKDKSTILRDKDRERAARAGSVNKSLRNEREPDKERDESRSKGDDRAVSPRRAMSPSKHQTHSTVSPRSASEPRERGGERISDRGSSDGKHRSSRLSSSERRYVQDELVELKYTCYKLLDRIAALSTTLERDDEKRERDSKDK